MKTDELSAAFYAALGEKMDWKDADGEPLPQWGDVCQQVKDGFAYAVEDLAATVVATLKLGVSTQDVFENCPPGAMGPMVQECVGITTARNLPHHRLRVMEHAIRAFYVAIQDNTESSLGLDKCGCDDPKCPSSTIQAGVVDIIRKMQALEL